MQDMLTRCYDKRSKAFSILFTILHTTIHSESQITANYTDHSPHKSSVTAEKSLGVLFIKCVKKEKSEELS